MALSSITPAGGGKVSMLINKSIPPCNSVTLHTWHLVTATLSQLWRLYSLEWAKVGRVLMCFGSTEHYPYSTTYLDIFCDDRFGSAVLEAVGRGRRTGLWIASLGDGEWWAVPTMHCPDRMLQGGIIRLLDIMIWNIWEPRKDNHKICPLSLRFRPFWYLGQYPPLRVGECRLPQYCSGILCCWSSLLPNIRWQKTGAVSGDWPTSNTGHTPTVWGTGGPGLFIKTVKLCKSHRLHLFVNNLLFTYNINHKHWKLLCNYKKMVMSAARVAAARLGGARATGDALHRSELQ